MPENDNLPLPVQEEGAEKNIESVYTAQDSNEAKQLFAAAKHRLLQVNKWHELAGTLSAVFQLTDEAGDPVDEPVAVDHYFKIDIPGPGTVAGTGYDWVRVEEVQETKDESADAEFVLIRVRPSDNPTTEDDNVAHFFSDSATSNFVVKRDGNTVTAAVYGRNEKPNTASNNLIDKARNAIVGTSAVAGVSNAQWKSLVDGLLAVK